jgi:glycerophosphoryl diester phosphodiesterase
MYHGKPGVHYDFDTIAEYAHGVGPDSKLVMWWPSETSVPIDMNTESAFINEMHDRDLQVHPWTLRNDDLQYTTNAADETVLYYTKGVDGIFTEFVSTTYGIFTQVFEQIQKEQGLFL